MIFPWVIVYDVYVPNHITYRYKFQDGRADIFMNERAREEKKQKPLSAFKTDGGAGTGMGGESGGMAWERK